MNGYTLTVTCLHCDSPLEHTAGSAAHPRLRSVVAACTSCGSQYRLNVELLVLNGPALRGTFTDRTIKGGTRSFAEWPTFEELSAPVLPWQAEVDAVIAADDIAIAAERKERRRLAREQDAA